MRHPMEMDWGKVTPDGLNRMTADALHVFSMYLVPASNREDCIQFIVAKVRWYGRHLPAGYAQRAVLDVREQGLLEQDLVAISTALTTRIASDENPIPFIVEFKSK